MGSRADRAAARCPRCSFFLYRPHLKRHAREERGRRCWSSVSAGQPGRSRRRAAPALSAEARLPCARSPARCGRGGRRQSRCDLRPAPDVEAVRLLPIFGSRLAGASWRHVSNRRPSGREPGRHNRRHRSRMIHFGSRMLNLSTTALTIASEALVIDWECACARLPWLWQWLRAD